MAVCVNEAAPARNRRLRNGLKKSQMAPVAPGGLDGI
jgi:hypothetical protein